MMYNMLRQIVSFILFGVFCSSGPLVCLTLGFLVALRIRRCWWCNCSDYSYAFLLLVFAFIHAGLHGNGDWSFAFCFLVFSFTLFLGFLGFLSDVQGWRLAASMDLVALVCLFIVWYFLLFNVYVLRV
jgi:hypothetical protein